VTDDETLTDDEWTRRAWAALDAAEQQRRPRPAQQHHRPRHDVANLAEAVKIQLRDLRREIATLRAEHRAELRAAVLEMRLELERAHRAELERLLADRPEAEKSAAASKLRLAASSSNLIS
jgi:hypothetical protein